MTVGGPVPNALLSRSGGAVPRLRAKEWGGSLGGGLRPVRFAVLANQDRVVRDGPLDRHRSQPVEAGSARGGAVC